MTGTLFAHEQMDLPHSLSVEDITQEMRLAEIKDREWKARMRACSGRHSVLELTYLILAGSTSLRHLGRGIVART